MKVLVCGGRKFTDWDRLQDTLNRLHKNFKFTLLIHGDALGADRLAELWATRNKIPVKSFVADWKRLGRMAGPARNRRMLTEGQPDMVIAFPGGDGTKNMIDQARFEQVPVMQIQPEPSNAD